jgi:hypothetical protein
VLPDAHHRPGERADRQQVIVHDDEYVPGELQAEVRFDENVVAGLP